MHSFRMRRNAIAPFLLLMLLPLFGCASATPPEANDPVITIEELPGSEFAVKRGAAVSVAYQISVKNTKAEPITLRRIDVTTGPRSPYKIEREEPVEVELTIAPGAEESTVFEAWVVRREEHAGNLVHLQGVAHFESSSGELAVKFWKGYHEPE